MSDTALADIAPDPVSLRAALRAQLAKRKSEEGRLAALQEARDRLRDQQRPLRSQLSQVESEQRESKREAGAKLVYAFLNSDTLEIDQLDATEAEAKRLRAELDKLEELETALDEEIARVQAGLRQFHTRVDECLAPVLTTSPEFLALVQRERNIWVELRGIKSAFRTIIAALHGQIGREFEHLADRVEPIEEGVYRGTTKYEVDPALRLAWAAALDALSQDAGAELPLLPGAAPAPPGAPLTRPARSPARIQPLRSVPMRALAVAPEGGD